MHTMVADYVSSQKKGNMLGAAQLEMYSCYRIKTDTTSLMDNKNKKLSWCWQQARRV